MVIRHHIDNCNQYHNHVLFYVIPFILYLIYCILHLIICQYGMLISHGINVSIHVVLLWLYMVVSMQYIYILVKAENSKFYLSFLYNIYINLYISRYLPIAKPIAMLHLHNYILFMCVTSVLQANKCFKALFCQWYTYILPNARKTFCVRTQ